MTSFPQPASITSPFSTSEVFKSREDLIEWAQNLAYSLGYVITINRSNKKSSGYMCKVYLWCDRSGFYKKRSQKIDETSSIENKNIKKRDCSSKKIDCPFELLGKYSKVNDFWTLKVIRDEHNHPPATHMEGHPYAMRLTPEEKNLVDDLSKKNVKPHDILSTIKQQNVNNCSSLKTIYNAREKIKMIEKQGLTEMQVFIALLHKKGFIFEPRVNENNVLEDFFFAHPLSLELWHAFPQVLLLDATYKTNRFNMPFLEIVSVTSINLTFCVAFAFLCKEMKDNYEWVLNCLKSTLDERVCPRVIVTDRAYALMNACETVFPDAKQLLCRWHISQSVFKFGRPSMKSLELWDSLDTAWKSVVLSSTVTSYVEITHVLKRY